MWIILLILQDLNEGALISAPSSSSATVLDNEDKVGKITSSVVGLQLNCYSTELRTYLSINFTHLSNYVIVLFIWEYLLLLLYYAGSHCQRCEKAGPD